MPFEISHKPLYISIAGVMGSGKTTASNLLSKNLGFKLFEETVVENKILPLYYQNPKRWSFHLQLFYLHQRIEQLSKIRLLLAKSNIVQDSPIYQDYLTYTKAQHILGHMNQDEFDLYEKYFHFLSKHFLTPNLIIQLNASVDTLMGRINKRSRDYEQSIDKAYLGLLFRLQNEWIAANQHLNILAINTDTMDLADNAADQLEFINLVKKKLEI